MWFLDFTNAMLGAMLADPGLELKPAAVRAYETALAPRHPWVLRMTVGAAMMMLPSRASFFDSLSGGLPPAELNHKLREFVHVMNRVRVELWDFYKAHNITELP
jgi:hypothetical protein